MISILTTWGNELGAAHTVVGGRRESILTWNDIPKLLHSSDEPWKHSEVITFPKSYFVSKRREIGHTVVVEMAESNGLASVRRCI